MKAVVTKEVIFKGMEISLENKNEVEALKIILVAAKSYMKEDKPFSFYYRTGAIQLLNELKERLYEPE